MLSKWWGWGEEGKEYRLPDPQRFWRYLRARLGPTEARSRIDSLERVHVSPSRLAAATLSPPTGIVGQGGALSHHHGIGSDHRAWMEPCLGPSSARWLAALKSTLDPGCVMNPGKLIPEPSLRENPPLAEPEAPHA